MTDNIKPLFPGRPTGTEPVEELVEILEDLLMRAKSGELRDVVMQKTVFRQKDGTVGGILGVLLGAAITQMLNNGLILLGYPSYWQTAAICTLMLVTFMLDYWRRQRLVALHGTSD